MEANEKASTAAEAVDETQFREASVNAEPQAVRTSVSAPRQAEQTFLMNARSDGTIKVKLVVGGTRRGRRASG